MFEWKVVLQAPTDKVPEPKCGCSLAMVVWQSGSAKLQIAGVLLHTAPELQTNGAVLSDIRWMPNSLLTLSTRR